MSGTVLDAVTRRPVENANVFLASSTIGTATGKDGRFQLTGVPPGRYQIVFSCVGYQTEIRVLDEQLSDRRVFDVALRTRDIAMPEVEVSADVDDDAHRAYRKLLDRFLREFIGERSNSGFCRVTNPQDVLVWLDGNDTLRASASKLIEVENRGLGYTLHVDLQDFVWLLSEDVVRFTVYSRFTPALARNGDEADQWRLNRRDTYLGSLTHFLSALVNHEVSRQGFQVATWREDGPKTFWMDPTRFDLMPIAGSRYVVWKQKGWLVVRYFRDYARETSFIRVNGDAALVDASGSLSDPMMVTVAGDWAKYRVSDMLPINADGEIILEAKKKSGE